VAEQVVSGKLFLNFTWFLIMFWSNNI